MIMPNWCSIDMTITAKTPDDAKKIHTALQTSYEKAQKEKVAMFLGSTEKYLFYSDFDLLDDSIYLHGDIKWSLDTKNAVEWIRWLKSHGEIIETQIKYEECGCQIFGRYHFNEKLLHDKYLPWEYFPKYDEEEPDSWNDLLNSALEKYGVETIVAEINV